MKDVGLNRYDDRDETLFLPSSPEKKKPYIRRIPNINEKLAFKKRKKKRKWKFEFSFSLVPSFCYNFCVIYKLVSLSILKSPWQNFFVYDVANEPSIKGYFTRWLTWTQVDPTSPPPPTKSQQSCWSGRKLQRRLRGWFRSCSEHKATSIAPCHREGFTSQRVKIHQKFVKDAKITVSTRKKDSVAGNDGQVVRKQATNKK